MNFPSTLLPQTNDPKEIQKGNLDLLTKINAVGAGLGAALDLNQSDYREKPGDGWDYIKATTGATSRTVTLAPGKQVLGRLRVYAKWDSGAGELILKPQGQDVIYLPGGASVTTLYVGLQSQSVGLVAVSGGYLWVSGVVQPVSGEPSRGTPHVHTVTLYSAGPADTSVHAINLKTVDPTLPSGIKMVAIKLSMASGVVDYMFEIVNAAGSWGYGRVRTLVAGKANDGYCLSPVDAGGNIYYKASNVPIALAIAEMDIYWM